MSFGGRTEDKICPSIILAHRGVVNYCIPSHFSRIRLGSHEAEESDDEREEKEL